MAMRQSTLLLSLAAALSLGGMVYSAAHELKLLSAACAGLFAITAITAGLSANAALRRQPAATPRTALCETTRLSAMIYAWASAALLLIYKASGLIWQHGWQYGLALALVAVGLALYARDLGRDGHGTREDGTVDAAIRLAWLHGLVTAAILVWLVASGKLMTERGDWAANHIFVAVTTSIVALSAVAIRTHKVLRERNT